MSEVTSETTVTRRHFMRNITISAIAAAAAGSGAALLTKKQQAPAVPLISEVPAVPTSIPAVQTAKNVATAHNDMAELLAQLASSQAENMRLKASLDASQRELDSLRPALSNGNATNNSLSGQLADTQSQLADYQFQLAESIEKIGILSGLVSLYEQLDDIDITDTVQNGMAVVSESIDNLLDQAPTLSEGIQAGQKALADVENHLPILENGRLWLDAQGNKLTTFYDAVEEILQNVMERVGSFLEIVEDWFSGIRKWLPFGIGEKAAQVINTISTLVAETPHTVSGLDTYLAQPLDVWLAREEDNEPRLQKNLIKPIREKVFVETDEAINRAQNIQAAFQNQLSYPVQEKAASRQVMREQITAYRQNYQV